MNILKSINGLKSLEGVGPYENMAKKLKGYYQITKLAHIFTLNTYT